MTLWTLIRHKHRKVYTSFSSALHTIELYHVSNYHRPE